MPMRDDQNMSPEIEMKRPTLPVGFCKEVIFFTCYFFCRHDVGGLTGILARQPGELGCCMLGLLFILLDCQYFSPFFCIDNHGACSHHFNSMNLGAAFYPPFSNFLFSLRYHGGIYSVRCSNCYLCGNVSSR